MTERYDRYHDTDGPLKPDGDPASSPSGRSQPWRDEASHDCTVAVLGSDAGDARTFIDREVPA